MRDVHFLPNVSLNVKIEAPAVVEESHEEQDALMNETEEITNEQEQDALMNDTEEITDEQETDNDMGSVSYRHCLKEERNTNQK
jgi:hypothetical protein